MAYSENQKQKILDEVCERVTEGEALRNVLKEKGKPDAKTFYAWIDADPIKFQQYARAKEMFAEKTFTDILNIADSTGNDIIITQDGKQVVNHDVVNRDKLRIDSRKWILARLNPKKYGDSSRIDHTTKGEKIGSDINLSNYTDEELRTIAELQRKGRTSEEKPD